MTKTNIHRDKPNASAAIRPYLYHIIFALIILLAIFLRVYHISADPPIDRGQGQSLSTDPPQYVHYAANKVTFGSWDNFARTKYVWHIFNLYSPLAYIAFSVFGPGLVQGNMVGVFYNLLAVILLFWVLRYRLGIPLALLGMFLLAINYEFIKIGRLSYLENIQVFVLLLSFGLLDRMDKWKSAIFLGGLVMAVGVFFCKASSVLSAVGLAAALILYWRYVQAKGFKEILKQLVIFGAGFIVVGLVWFFWAYLPTIHQVWDGKVSTAFFSRAAAFDSANMFVFYMYTIFVVTKFILHAPIQSLLAIVFMIIIIARFAKLPKSISLQELLWPLGIIFVFVGIFYWEYRPIRYQVVTSPLLAASTVWLLHLIKENKFRVKYTAKLAWIIFIVGAFLFSIFWFSILCPSFYKTSEVMDNFWKVTFFSWLFAIASMLLYRQIFFNKSSPKASKARRVQSGYTVLFAAVIVICSFINIGLYWDAMDNLQYTFRDATREIATALNKDAYLIGTYAPLLTVDDKIRSDTPIWGTDTIPQFNERFPATHIVQELHGPLMKVLNQEYPGIQDSSLLLGYILVRGVILELWKLPTSYSRHSRTYTDSDFEMAVKMAKSGQTDKARTMLMEIEQKAGKMPIIEEILRNLH